MGRFRREEESGKEREEGVEIMTGEGGKGSKEAEMGIIRTQNLMGMLLRE